MDNRISIGDKIDLEKIDTRLSIDPDKKPDVYISQVLDEAPNNRIYAAMPLRGGTVIPLGVGQRFNATFYSNSGLLRCEVVVTGRYKKGSFFLVELEQTNSLEKVQRREYFRYECRNPIRYRIVEDEERELVQAGNTFFEDERPLVWKDGIMLDLSGGGIRFVSAFKEQKKSFIQVCFEITYNEEVEVIYAYADLLRSERNRNNNTIYDQRISFWGMDNGLREKIIHYIFDEQRKKRSQQMG